MKRRKIGILMLASAVLAAPRGARAVTRDIADLEITPLSARQSVISQLSGGVLRAPYDEFLYQPYNLAYGNIERLPNLTPWPGQEGEQNRYVDFLIGNNGSSNVRNGADTLEGTYIGQPAGKFAWGMSAALLADDLQNSDAAAGSSFGDGEQLSGADTRVAFGYRISERIVLGGGINRIDRTDEVQDNSFNQGVGGFSSIQGISQSGMAADFGLRLFTTDTRSWDAGLQVGFGSTDSDDFSEFLDDTGAVVARNVISDYDTSDSYAQLAGGYNRRHVDNQGEMQVRFGIRRTQHELDNTNLSYTDDGVTVTPSLVLLGQDPVLENEVFASADTLFVRGWTQIFGGARLSMCRADGSTQVDSMGTVVDESIDDSLTHLAMVMGLRQPLWSERFRLVVRARADWMNESQSTNFGIAATGTDRTQTSTAYAMGLETVLNNMAFDVAWLFGGEPAPTDPLDSTRQTIDLDRVVVSAAFGW